MSLSRIGTARSTNDRLEAISPETAVLFRHGHVKEAVESLTGEPLPIDLLSAFYPSDECRQDLENWNTILERSLAARRPAFFKARATLSRKLGRIAAAGEGAALLAYCDIVLGRYDRGLAALRLAAKTAPSSFALHVLHGVTLWLKTWHIRSRELLPEALTAVDKALAHDASDPRVYMLRAGIKRELEDLDGHLTDVNKALALHPDFLWALAEKAENLGERGTYREAFPVVQKLIALQPKSSWVYVHRARLRAFHGYHALAMRDFNRAVTLDSSCGAVYAWRGEARRRQGDLRGALEDFDQALRLQPTYRFPHLWKGRVHLLRGEFPAAIACFTRTLELEPREGLAESWRAEAWWKMGETRRAALGFEAVYPSEPRMAWNRLLKEGENQEVTFMGGNSTPRGREEAMREDLDRVVALCPQDPWAWAFRGRCLLSRSLLRESLADLTRAAALDGTQIYARKWRGECLRRLGYPSRAISDLDVALSRGAKDPWLWAFRARARAETGDVARAEADFDRALRKPGQRHAVIFLWRGEWRHAQGRLPEARRDFEDSFRLEGKDPRVLEWLKRTAV